MDQDDPALSVMLDEWHRQCHLGATQLDAMTAVLAAYRRHVLDHRPDASYLAKVQQIEEALEGGSPFWRSTLGYLLAALADVTARAEAAEAQRDEWRDRIKP